MKKMVCRILWDCNHPTCPAFPISAKEFSMSVWSCVIDRESARNDGTGDWMTERRTLRKALFDWDVESECLSTIQV